MYEIIFNTLYMVYVNVILDVKYRKQTEGKTLIMRVYRIQMLLRDFSQ